MTFQVERETGLALRQAALDNARRVVVKVGSAVLTTNDGLNREVIAGLAAGITALRQSGRQVILVSSGAVAAGRKKLGGDRTGGIRAKQALAAAGQCTLMRTYEELFAGSSVHVAQILLTHDDLAHRNRYLNARNTLFTLLDWQVLPIINENDTVSVEELRFGDNDTLAALVTNLTEADLLVCLTDVAGLYTGNPGVDPAALPVCTVARVDRAVEEMAGSVSGTLVTGGMRSKIMAAKTVAARGGASFIVSGRESDVLQRLFAGEPLGTFFMPNERRMQSRKHWIAYTLRPKGDLVLDNGAVRALVSRGTSLLPAGIRAVHGKFGKGAPVQCVDEAGQPVAFGLVNYSSDEITRILGAKTSAIEAILGYKDDDEVIHRDNLVLRGEIHAIPGE